MATAGPELADIDLSDLRFWMRPPDERMAAFAVLRAQERPVLFAEPPIPFMKRGNGYYALVRHADVQEASRNPQAFSNEPVSTSPVDQPRWMAERFGSLVNMDDPRHAQIRRVVSRAFTPRMLARAEQDIQRRAARIVDDLIVSGSGTDFVAGVSVRLPVEVICDMLGIADRHYDMVMNRTNIILGNSDAEYTGITPDLGRLRTGIGLAKIFLSGQELYRMAMRLGRERAKNPADDVTSLLMNSEIDGEALTPEEFGAFFILLVVAGNETTRTAISHGLKLLTDHPAQRELLLEDFGGRIPGAVEEIIRYSTPVMGFRRTLLTDYELNGLALRKGDKVVLYYNSANRDEMVFTDPEVFDIARSPNPHVSFGGPGPHYCLGAHLAKREVTIMFRELFARLPDIRSVGEPDRLVSGFINGIKRMRCEFTR